MGSGPSCWAKMGFLIKKEEENAGRKPRGMTLNSARSIQRHTVTLHADVYVLVPQHVSAHVMLCGSSPYSSCTFAIVYYIIPFHLHNRNAQTQASREEDEDLNIRRLISEFMIMTFAMNHLGSKLFRRGFGTMTTIPVDQGGPKFKLEGKYVPVYVALGMILLSTSLGIHTAKQHLAYSPEVRMRKSRREKLSDVEEPEVVANEAEKFIKRSFFRRLAHVQQYEVSVPVGVNKYSGNALEMAPHVEPFKAEAKQRSN